MDPARRTPARIGGLNLDGSACGSHLLVPSLIKHLLTKSHNSSLNVASSGIAGAGLSCRC